jgi:tRNA A-37 threonylcarbamoyl transferase component Bud32
VNARRVVAPPGVCHHDRVAIGRTDLGLPDVAVLAGRYRPLAPVGRGAIAEVVRARDEATGRQVALKILYPHLRESAAVAERFKREVEIVRRVAHPHVLAIHDIVESDGQLFLVMDYHPGGDLADRLARRGPLPPDELRVLASQLCGALGAAHRAGVVHRDVKPSNVLCGPGPTLEGGGAPLDVRLCDFGLARASELSGLTTANAVLGTPEYMAPEVITDGHADPRSDIYSLGVVLYEAATGKLPFHGDSPYQLMRQHVDVEAPRVRALAPGTPMAVDAAIARALAKDPLDRFATVEDLERALAVGDGEAAPSLVPRPDPPAAAALAPRAGSGPPLAAAVGARRTCRRCGGWLVEAAAACADCGATTLRLDRERGGSTVLVTGPGNNGDKVDAWRHVALYKILEELPAGALPAARGRRGAPRVPFHVAKDLTAASADALVTRLAAAGFEARALRASVLPAPGMARKVWRLTWRYLAGGLFVLQTQGAWHDFLPRSWGVWRALMGVVALGATAVVTLASISVRATRPLLSGPIGGHGDAARARLGHVLPTLESRQDRRLVARLLERLEQLEGLGHAEVAAPAARRATDAAEALGSLESRRRYDASVRADAAGALEELRREERLRVLLRAYLLRASSRLDDLTLVATRARADGSVDERARLAGQIRDLGFAIDAEEEVAAFLEARP